MSSMFSVSKLPGSTPESLSSTRPFSVIVEFLFGSSELFAIRESATGLFPSDDGLCGILIKLLLLLFKLRLKSRLVSPPFSDPELGISSGVVARLVMLSADLKDGFLSPFRVLHVQIYCQNQLTTSLHFLMYLKEIL